MKNYKIALFMLPPLTQGAGAEKYFIDLARSLADRGYDTDVITMDDNFFRKFARLLHILKFANFFGFIPMTGREREDFIRSRLGSARWMKSSWRELGDTLRKYDIIYSKNEIVDLAILKLKGYGKLPPLIVGVHTPICYPCVHSLFSKAHNFLYSSFFYRWLVSGAKCVHLSNRFTTDLVEKKFKAKTRLIYYPFSTGEIKESSENVVSDLYFNKEKSNIIFVGRLTEQKGVDTLSRIIKKLAEEKEITEKIAVNIFGSGDKPSEGVVKNLANKYPFVRYFGHIKNKYMPNILARHDLSISTSRWETLPFTVLEAQALGLPVIAFDIPGPSDIIVNGKTGFLVKSEREFVEKIMLVAGDKAAFDRQEIIRHIDTKFDPEKIISQMIDMFEKNI